MRKKYLRLLFEVYIRYLSEDPVRIDVNTKTFYDMMFYVVLEDLRSYAQYYNGLMAPSKNNQRRDNASEALRDRTKEALKQRSIEDVRRRNMQRTR